MALFNSVGITRNNVRKNVLSQLRNADVPKTEKQIRTEIAALIKEIDEWNNKQIKKP
jgi:hypothetical protein